MRGGIDDGVQPVPVGFVAVQGEVLDRGDDLFALDAFDRLRAQHSGEPGILGQVLEVPAVARVAVQVEAAGQLDVESFAAGLPAHQAPGSAGEFGVEGGTEGDRRRERRGGVSRPVARVGDAQARVAHQQRGDAQPRDAGRIAGAHRDTVGDARVLVFEDLVGAHDADEKRETLIVRQLGFGSPGPFHRFRVHAWPAFGQLSAHTKPAGTFAISL